MPTHIGERDTGYQIITAHRHEMNVATALAVVDRNRGYPRHDSRQLSRRDKLVIAAMNLIAD
jgi:hypothetical protein